MVERLSGIFLRSEPRVSAIIARPGEAMKQPVERRLAAILAADVAGYSRLMGADEEGTHERLRAHLRGVEHWAHVRRDGFGFSMGCMWAAGKLFTHSSLRPPSPSGTLTLMVSLAPCRYPRPYPTSAAERTQPEERSQKKVISPTSARSYVLRPS